MATTKLYKTQYQDKDSVVVKKKQKTIIINSNQYTTIKQLTNEN